MTQAPTVHLDRCIEVAGNDRVGRFLYRLWKWQARTRHLRNGRRWVSWSYAEWAVALNLTYTQFKYMIEKATAADPVLREQHRYGRKVPNFICLTAKGLEALCAAQVAQKCATQVAQNCATLKSNLKNKTEEKKQTASGFAVATPETPEEPSEEFSGEIPNNVVKFPGEGGPMGRHQETRLETR